MSHSFSEVTVASSVFTAYRCAESVLVLLMIVLPASAQSQTGTAATDVLGRDLATAGLQERVGELEGEVAELKRIVKELQSSSQPVSGSQSLANAQLTSSAQPQSASVDPSTLTPRDRASLDFLRDTTINVRLDGYYAFNF